VSVDNAFSYVKGFDEDQLIEFVNHNLDVSTRNFERALEITKEIQALIEKRDEYRKVGQMFQKLAKQGISELSERKGV
jgi:predicted RNA-binding protein associated with RNAse of E/G family